LYQRDGLCYLIALEVFVLELGALASRYDCLPGRRLGYQNGVQGRE
jgi:hypothetical protein